jgi:prevent-host-death family protein
VLECSIGHPRAIPRWLALVTPAAAGQPAVWGRGTAQHLESYPLYRRPIHGPCYVCYMRTISHRELRNNSSSVLREVENGESFAVTNRGEVVAALVPAGAGRDLQCVRPARRRPSFSTMTRRVVAEPSEIAVAELREDR